jgi:hypothetical protein
MSIAVKVMIYPKYMIINKTDKDIIYNENFTILSRTNDYLMGKPEEKDKIRFSVNEMRVLDNALDLEQNNDNKVLVARYKESDVVDLSNIGLSGEIKLDLNEDEGEGGLLTKDTDIK